MVDLMRLKFLLAATWFSLISLGQSDPISPESLPEAVVNTIKAESAAAKVDQVESYTWGAITIYRVILKLNDKPYMELHIAETGKLVREDSLVSDTAEMDGTDEGDNAADDPSPSPTPTPKK